MSVLRVRVPGRARCDRRSDRTGMGLLRQAPTRSLPPAVRAKRCPARPTDHFQGNKCCRPLPGSDRAGQPAHSTSLPLPGHPISGPNRGWPGTMDHAVEASAQRVRDHLRRPIPGRRNLLMNTAGNTVREIDPSRIVDTPQEAMEDQVEHRVEYGLEQAFGPRCRACRSGRLPIRRLGTSRRFRRGRRPRLGVRGAGTRARSDGSLR
jgi:hypothetical protein